MAFRLIAKGKNARLCRFLTWGGSDGGTGADHDTFPIGVIAQPSVGSPTLGQVHALSLSGISASPSVGLPALLETTGLVPSSISAAPSVGSPSVSQTHSLAPSSISSAPSVGAPSLSGTVNPVISTATFTNTEDGTRDSMALTGTYAGADQVDLVLQFRQSTTLRATATITNITITSGSFAFNQNINPGDLTYESGSSATDMPNVDNIQVTVQEANNGGSATTNVSGVSGLDVIAPTFSSAEIGNVDATSLIVTFPEAMRGSTTAADWAVVVNGSPATESGVAFTPGGTTADITLGAAVTNGQTVTVAYSGTGLTDEDGNALATFTAQSVTNNVAASPTVPAAFVDANWSVATGSGASELDVTIASLPANGGAAISNVQYDVDGNGTWTSLPSYAGTGTYTITMAAASTSYAIRLRAVNSVGAAAAGNSESATSGASGGAFSPRYIDSLFVTGGETNFTHTLAFAKTGLTTGNNLVVMVHSISNSTGTLTSVGLVGDTPVTVPAVNQNPGAGSHNVAWFLVPVTASPGDLQIITGGGADLIIPSVEIFEVDPAWTLQNNDAVFGGDTSLTANVTDVNGGLTIGYSWAVTGTQLIGGVTEPTADADGNAYAAGAGGETDRGTVGSAIGTGANARAIVSGVGADTARLAAGVVFA